MRQFQTMRVKEVKVGRSEVGGGGRGGAVDGSTSDRCFSVGERELWDFECWK